MNKTEKGIIIFYLILAVSYMAINMQMNQTYASVKFPNESTSPINELDVIQNTAVNKTKIFTTISDLKDYPIISPQHFISVTIVNQSKTGTFAEIEVVEKFVKEKILVKHSSKPFETQTLEVMDGDAKGTILTQTFYSNSSGTFLTTHADLHLSGKLYPLSFVPKQLVKQELGSVINDFIDYAAGYDNEYESTVDHLYREILHRPADKAGLMYYSYALKSGKMTVDDIRNTLANSQEAKMYGTTSSIKGIDELNGTTKKIITQLYNQILHRQPDIQGMSYYGSALENSKMTVDDIRNTLANSQEAKMYGTTSSIKGIDELNGTTKKIITQLYNQILHRQPDIQGMSYYGSALENSKMTVDDIRNTLANSQEARSYMDPTEFMPIYELNNNTKDTINEIYIKVYDRTPLPNEMVTYGSYLQNGKMTADQIKNILISEKTGK